MTLGDVLKKVTHLGHKDKVPQDQIPSGSGAAMPPAPEIHDASTPAGAVGETPGEKQLENAIKVGEPGILPGTDTKIAEPFPLPGMGFGGHRATSL